MNKKLFNFIFILFSSFILVDITSAQTKPLACQDDAASGLKWENEHWIIKKFIESDKAKYSRNSLCPCSSGYKVKNCHGKLS